MVVRPWVFEFFPELKNAGAPGSGAVARYFEDYLKLWTEDEALGFEGIFFSEHHFKYSFSASPNLLIAALAQRTKRLRLGVMGVVLPYYHPIRVIEEMGILDNLTCGRLEIGTALGIPQELDRLDINAVEARERFDEVLEVMDAAITGKPRAEHAGKHFHFHDVNYLPPLHQVNPARWTTVVSEGSARKVAQRRSKICTGFFNTDHVRMLFDAYRDEAAKIGFEVTPEHFALRRRVSVAPDETTAQTYAAEAMARYQAFVTTDPRFKANAVPDAPGKSGGGFSVSEDEFITGSPAKIADEIRRQCEATGAAHFLSVFHWGAEYDEVSAAHRLFGEQVIPKLRS
jgi:alkanesulfonate monooxygenase SsuD/methylene tetrahydromethanopterin reductase-like flavin-dependent oxidoreductase (luciferase family)